MNNVQIEVELITVRKNIGKLHGTKVLYMTLVQWRPTNRSLFVLA